MKTKVRPGPKITLLSVLLTAVSMSTHAQTYVSAIGPNLESSSSESFVGSYSFSESKSPLINTEGVFQFSQRNNITASQDFVLFPNPTRNEFNIHFQNDALREIEIFSIDGKSVYYDYSKESDIKINLNLEKGQYIVSVKSENTTMQKKLVINY